MIHRAVFLFTLITILGLNAPVVAEMPHKLNFQGKLLDPLGSPTTTETNVLFAIWDAEVDGDSLWSEEQLVQPDDEGIINVILGSSAPIPDSAFATEVWLSAKVGFDPELTPRLPVVSVGYAFRVSTLDGSTGGLVSGTITNPGDSDTTIIGEGQIVIRGPGGEDEAVYAANGVTLYVDDGALARSQNPEALETRVELLNNGLKMYAPGGGVPNIELGNAGSGIMQIGGTGGDSLRFDGATGIILTSGNMTT